MSDLQAESFSAPRRFRFVIRCNNENSDFSLFFRDRLDNLDTIGIEVRRRLIQNQKPGVMQESKSVFEALLHARGIDSNAVVPPRPQVDKFKQLFHSRIERRFSRANP